jgi:hypothetical protein
VTRLSSSSLGGRKGYVPTRADLRRLLTFYLLSCVINGFLLLLDVEKLYCKAQVPPLAQRENAD